MPRAVTASKYVRIGSNQIRSNAGDEEVHNAGEGGWGPVTVQNKLG